MSAHGMVRSIAIGIALLAPTLAGAQTSPAPAAEPTPAGGQAPAPLVLFFASGSDAIRAQDDATLDQAARLYRDGNPIVMVVSGSTDTAGAPEPNLLLSQRRAGAVVRGLIARGIPASRFQVVAKGETDLSVATDDNTAEERNRRAEITWR